ncbi:hypothetical protein [Microvirga mediterraneensis]|uniref:hypothetical protein n=1 Tax=Microvirga mediterraneensis TaxID=2754695 RepID=UPI001FEA58AC|nr:hypothetical protein [Microvirga mediterraneensis]
MPDFMTNDCPSSGNALFSDLYQLTMLRAYGELGMNAVAYSTCSSASFRRSGAIFWPAA